LHGQADRFAFALVDQLIELGTLLLGQVEPFGPLVVDRPGERSDELRFRGTCHLGFQQAGKQQSQRNPP
jgi:hypothetical protein